MHEIVLRYVLLKGANQKKVQGHEHENYSLNFQYFWGEAGLLGGKLLPPPPPPSLVPRPLPF